MSRVVFVSRSSYGHINPTLALVSELVNCGEKVYYLANEHFKESIESTGCTYIKSGLYLNLLYGYSYSNQNSNSTDKRTEDEFMAGVKKFYSSVEYICALTKKVRDYILNLQPNYIIYDSTIYFIKDAFHDSGIPCISTRAYFAFNREIFYVAPHIFSDIFSVKLHSDIHDVIRRIDQMTQDSYLKYGHYYDYLDSKNNLNIVFTSKEFQPYANYLDDSYHFAGNSLSFRQKQKKTEDNNLSRYGKFVLISFGSWLGENQIFLNFYKKIMCCFDSFNATFIMNIGRVPKEDFEFVPNNFILENGINQLELLELADLFITHGGMNSASEALQLKTPMLVLPIFFDQFIVADQIEKTGLGRQYLGFDIDFGELKKLVIEMLNNPQYHQNLIYMASTYRATGEEKGAVDKIFDYVGKAINR